MAKTTKAKKTAKASPVPSFDPGRCLGSNMNCFIVADANGKAWQFDLQSGTACPVNFLT